MAELFANKSSYAGKKVKVTGQVVKFSPEIMNKNWVHLQDGKHSACYIPKFMMVSGSFKVSNKN